MTTEEHCNDLIIKALIFETHTKGRSLASAFLNGYHSAISDILYTPAEFRNDLIAALSKAFDELEEVNAELKKGKEARDDTR